MKLAAVRSILRFAAKRVRDHTPLPIRQDLVRHLAVRLKVEVEFPDASS